MTATASGKVVVSMTVNGDPVEELVEPRWLLADFLRENLGLTGTHVGCEHGVCGACTILMNGDSVRACLTFVVQAQGADIETVESLGTVTDLDDLQESFRKHHALQCGFCTPGLVMRALDLVARNPDPSAAEVREWLEGNLCRCTGYHNIVKSILAGASAMRGGS